jgi:hypothetical protein
LRVELKVSFPRLARVAVQRERLEGQGPIEKRLRERRIEDGGLLRSGCGFRDVFRPSRARPADEIRAGEIARDRRLVGSFSSRILERADASIDGAVRRYATPNWCRFCAVRRPSSAFSICAVASRRSTEVVSRREVSADRDAD